MCAFTPTKEQHNAIVHPGSLVAIANPGSGKTAVVAIKIQNILREAPSYKGVIGISYTNKASEELRRRVASGATNMGSSFFGTIDSFCLGEVVIPFASHLWGKPESVPATERLKDLEPEEAESFEGVQANQMSLQDIEDHLRLLKRFFLSGRILLESSGALALYIVQNSKACRRFLRARFTHVIIDEYQDSGLEQHQLFLKLHELGLVAIAVGDANQSIYGFSNTDPKHLLSLVAQEGFKTFPITHNHRCHPSITNYSLRFFKVDADLLAADEIRVFTKTCAGQAGAIAKWIEGSIPKIALKYGVKKMSDVGILVKSGSTGALVTAALTAKHRYFASDALDEESTLWGRLFKALLGYRFDMRVTAQEIIDGNSNRLTDAEVRDARKIFKELRETIGEEIFDKIEEIAGLLLPNARKEESVQVLRGSSFENYRKLFAPAADDEMQVMTLHKSKGLELDIVFHLDLHEWTFPNKRPGPNNDFERPVFGSLIQDANLHYVGITRARKACFLCTSTRRLNSAGQDKQGNPSEFLTAAYLAPFRLESPF